MGALVGETPLIQHQNLVRPANLRQAMGNEKGGALAANSPHRLLNLVFCGAVDGAGTVIQNQNAGIGKEGTGNGNALTLSAGQRDAPLAHFCFIPFIKAHDKVMGLGFLGGRFNIGLRCIGHTKCNIFRQGS